MHGGGTGTDGVVLGNMSTYLMKLGSGNLGRGYSTGLDRKVADSMPAYMVRFRQQNIAILLADALAAALAGGGERAVRMVNVAGGPSMDSLNAVILVRRDHPELLAGRRVTVQVLDLDDKGPAFGVRAVEALCAPGGPLAGVNVSLEHVAYDWSEPSCLRMVFQEGEDRVPVVCGSSEGGLFAYCTDDLIAANLEMLHALTPAEFRMIGSVMKINETTNLLRNSTRLAIRAFEPADFDALVGRAGWSVERELYHPTIRCLCLRKTDGRGAETEPEVPV